MCGGKHFVYNALCAICVGIENDIPDESILEGIKHFELTKRRMEIIERGDGIKIIDASYNASYDSMKAEIEALLEFKSDRKIAILGDMLELGEYARELHEKVGEEVYKNNVDILITVGENSKYIAKKALDLGMKAENVFIYDINENAISKIKDIMKIGDAILIKASNGMNFNDIVRSIR